MLGIGQPAAATGGPLPAPGWAGVGTATLRNTDVRAAVAAPLRLDHHLLMLVTAGHGTHHIDFVAHQCRPGTLLWARPGQVVRYGGQVGLDAVLVSWTGDLLTARETGGAPLDDPFGPTYWQLAGEDEDAVITEVSQLVVDTQRHRSGVLAAELMRHELAVLMLRIALLPATGRRGMAGPEAQAFARFRRELEASYAHCRRVEEYAGRLGCSVRTLTRACLTATGRSAKQVVDDRVALQAKRLLACTDLSVAEVGRQLGFPEPTNFGRFFQREAGHSPGAFRAGTRRSGHALVPTQRRPRSVS